VRTGEIDLLGAVPLFEQAAAVLAARIAASRYPARLPSERALARELGISAGTVRHATQALQQRGLVIILQGRGTFAVPSAPPR